MSPVKKRERDEDDTDATLQDSNKQDDNATSSGPGGTSSNFRNVSACNRCRHRKNRCDQKLPQCSACVKANAPCVGFDPVSKRELPRSYVYFLERRLISLERLLQQNNIPVPPPEESFPISAEVRPGVNVPFPQLDEDPGASGVSQKAVRQTAKAENASSIDPALRRGTHADPRSRTKAAAGVRPAPPDLRRMLPQRTMQPPGISFSKVVFAAVRSSVSQSASEKGGEKSSRDSIRKNSLGSQDCFFGLVTKPNVAPAPWPEYELGLKLVKLYFEHANPQIPILHRGEYMSLFERVYAKPASDRTAREQYLLLIVFASGSGIIMDGSNTGKKSSSNETKAGPDQKRQRLETQQYQPEEYHAAAMTHLGEFLSTPAAMDGHGGGIEELQAVLLSAALALLRPIAPGLWYIVGVAVRLAVDLGLHFEDADPELDSQGMQAPSDNGEAALRIGRKQWKRDLRRRLWWCVYSYDRLVSTCVGRPFGITDQVVTTEFPTLLDDIHITKAGLTGPESGYDSGPTYKLVSHHYFRLRLLQSEVLQVLQYRQAQQARLLGANAGNVYMHTRLPSPFLQNFSSFREWRADVDRRLGEWKDSAPSEAQIGVAFTPLFLELNYWQAIIMLYRQSLAVPAPLAEEMSAMTGEHVSSPSTVNRELQQDEQLVFLKVAQAGQMVIKTYRQLHRLKLVNYTFLATHHLFMSGISFLYALWHSPQVRSQLTLDDVDFTILAGTSILGDLTNNCPPAEACRDAFQRMSRATIGMCMSTTGFGSMSTLGTLPVETPGGSHSGSWTERGASVSSPAEGGGGYFNSPQSAPSVHSMLSGRGDSGATNMQRQASIGPRNLPKFDMDLNSLFSGGGGGGDELTHRPSLPPMLHHQRQPSQQQQQQQQQQQLAISPGVASQGSMHGSPHEHMQPPVLSRQGSYHISNRAQYTPLAEAISASSQSAGMGTLEKLDFLDSFVVDDPSGQAPSWMDGIELDLGFGMGGTAGMGEGNVDAQGQWQYSDEVSGAHNGGVDLFEGFFFGN